MKQNFVFVAKKIINSGSFEAGTAETETTVWFNNSVIPSDMTLFARMTAACCAH